VLGSRAVAGGGRVEAGPQPYDPAQARELVGSYGIDAMTATIGSNGSLLRLEVRIKGDEYILTSGALTGQRGFFTRDDSGAVVGIDLAGRFATRVPTPST
jgi:hypothetical protein